MISTLTSESSTEDLRDQCTFDDSGSAYLYQKRQAAGDTWEQAFKLSTSLRFGYAVAVDGSTLAVGAIADSNHNSASAVFIYDITE